MQLMLSSLNVSVVRKDIYLKGISRVRGVGFKETTSAASEGKVRIMCISYCNIPWCEGKKCLFELLVLVECGQVRIHGGETGGGLTEMF